LRLPCRASCPIDFSAALRAMDPPSRKALAYTFRRGHCAPSILEALIPEGDPRVTPQLKLVAGLPGGIGNYGAECGGLTAVPTRAPIRGTMAPPIADGWDAT
jgi:hypothetical protein